ncbi:tetratricopeptide repeat protein [Bradyrhizobium lablabi]|jgi:tetratricopeptide (TPR) repeat protein|uniref:tetratricopeptide repeat protein n=1 Tax=Bradyrhizobium lablabi TaxID=722472 RepID=UPI00090A8FAC|nr:tetratricopeptide repeat protein [Bradyrhizobium lablabi]SHK92799.1 Tetratricopeptide repeat-containing protein [Bradyrhizobium lablabi]
MPSDPPLNHEFFPAEDASPAPNAKRRLHTRTKEYLKAQIRNRTAAELALFAKGLAVALVTIVPTILTVIVISKAMVENGIVMTALRVPQSFEAAGYTSDTATQRLLDEIAALNRKSNAAKPKTVLGDTQLIDALSSIETPAGNLDLKSFQSLIQRVLGKTIIQISGEITTRKEDGKELTRLRLRQTPGRESLIDVETAQGAEDLFKKAALNLLEHIDPEIAAGIYFREYGDEESAMRLTAVALAGGHPDAEKYALNLRAYIYLGRGQIDQAMAASDSARAMDPDFVAVDYAKAFVLLAQKRPEEALESAKRGVDRAPDSDNSYNSLGIVLNAIGRKDEAIEAHKMALRKNNRSIVGYRRLAISLRDAGRSKEASEALLTGVAMVPSSAMLQSDYGEDLQRQGRNYEALGSLRKAYEMQPDNIRFQVGLAEAEFGQGHAADGSRLSTIIKNRVSNGEKLPANIKQRADKLISRATAPDSEAVTPPNPAR